jgi:triosephosphate isomerase
VSQIVEEVSTTITGNNILNGTNNGSGAFTGIISSAAVATANINNNIIRSHSHYIGSGLYCYFKHWYYSGIKY